MLRSCPHSDTICPHGMSCTFSCATDAYNGTKVPLRAQSAEAALAALREGLEGLAGDLEREAAGWLEYALGEREIEARGNTLVRAAARIRAVLEGKP